MMKGNEAEYVIPLRDAFRAPPLKRVRKANLAIHRFVFKHTRQKNVTIMPEVNEFIHLHSKNIPRRISAVLVAEEGKIKVFLAGGKQLAEEKKKKTESEKKKKAAAKEKDAKPEEKKAEPTPEEKEKQEKLKEKKAKELAASAVSHKRKTDK
ncbi:MAG: hypothetical protein HY917_05380 [Candidatus Diapherotrites archaeon]|nr:hypothetical protein [Candidatus Diapherotrites archaeon]